jgi:hypothetical protein
MSISLTPEDDVFDVTADESLIVYGLDGSDAILVNMTDFTGGTTILYGGDGNDKLDAYGFAQLYGGGRR